MRPIREAISGALIILLLAALAACADERCPQRLPLALAHRGRVSSTVTRSPRCRN